MMDPIPPVFVYRRMLLTFAMVCFLAGDSWSFLCAGVVAYIMACSLPEF